MAAFYNEIDPYAAQWLRNLITAGHIAPGVVDERSIEEIEPADLAGFTQIHFFAGIGVWSHALRLARWPDNRPVWTGSCPCQPFSTAGKRKGVNDKRHLWPHFFRLIQKCRPPVVLGEQVASKDGLVWLDSIQTDLEGADYAFGAADLCAAGVGAPHIRQRLWFVGVSDAQGRRQHGLEDPAGTARRRGAQDDSDVLRLGHGGSERTRWNTGADGRSQGEGASEGLAARSERDGAVFARVVGRLGNTDDERCEGVGIQLCGRGSLESMPQTDGDCEGEQGPVNEHWYPADWVLCRDPGGPRWRPVEPGTFPLAHGAPARVGRLRAYGNAIVAPLAQTWIEAVMESIP